MKLPEFKTEKIENLGITFSVTPGRKTKYWCWAYESEETAKFIIEQLSERWLDCPVTAYVDFTEVFVKSPQEITFTQIKQEQIKPHWLENQMDIKKVSGCKNENM